MFGLENSNHSFMNRSGTKLETNLKIVTGIVLNLISDTVYCLYLFWVCFGFFRFSPFYPIGLCDFSGFEFMTPSDGDLYQLAT